MDKQEYVEKGNLFKILSDPNRLQIINLLSNKEKCGCELLEKFNITQPTLSHHMKVLIDSEIITSRKEANWVYYKLNSEKMKEVVDFLKAICKNNNSECDCK